MKKAVFVRHAKSSWKDLTLDDHDRPLNERGKRDAPVMAAHLHQRYSHVDLVMCSTAKRAQKTWGHFAKEIQAAEVKQVPQLYHASPQEIIETIVTLDDRYKTVLYFGHNPGYTYLYNHFSINRLDNLPTCGMFEVMIEGKWKHAQDSDRVKTGFLMYPKMFG